MTNSTNKYILGVKVNDLTREEALSKIRDNPLPIRGIIATVGPEFILTAQNDPEFKDIINNSFLSLPEGFGLQLVAGIKNRIPGVDFVLDLCSLAAKNNWSVGLLGGQEGISIKTAEVLKEKFPSLKISFAFDGHLADETVNSLQIPKTDILFVAYGHPKQEKILKSFQISNFKFQIGMGVGGSFDLISGAIPRAPKFLQSLGLEWLWRLLKEPQRFKRILNAVIIFPIKIYSNNIKNILIHH